MEFKGTKGNWYTNELNNRIVSENDCLIATVLDGLGNAFNSNMQKIDIQEANSKLIACAPEMLEMLKDILSGMKNENYEVCQTEIQELIKKATTI